MNPTAATPSGGAAGALSRALAAQRPTLVRALWISTVIGALMLVPSWYMFEVYGRVLNSRNTTTLMWLIVMVMGIYLVIELLELLRHRLLHGAGIDLERRLREPVFNAVFHANLRKLPGGSLQPFNDLKALREVLPSSVVTALMDLPGALICLIVLFLMGPWLGVLALVGALVQVWLLWLTERHTMPLLTHANGSSILANQYATNSLRNAQVIESMGMLGHIRRRWQRRHREFLVKQGEASDYGGVTSAAAKVLQSMQGSVLLGGGCWIALHGGLWGGTGMVIIASILGGRALQPLAVLVQNWRVVIQARDSHARLSVLLAQHVETPPGLKLPPPKGVLMSEAVAAAAPGQQALILRGVTFQALPGEVTAIIGPTASGKSTLARLLVGIWPAQGGKVRLDGADVHGWNKDELGPHVGYLPQNVELFDGTVAENIARFGAVDLAKVEDAVNLVGLATLISELPHGLDTRIGDDGAILSGGQRQRLGLARALYGQPQLIVLDEPNSSLDTAGEEGLVTLMQTLKSRGATVVVITHRNTLMSVTDRLLVLREGQVAAFGPRDQVLAALAKANEQARAQQATAPRPAALNRQVPVEPR